MPNLAIPPTVHLVGAGPGDPDLVTVRGLRLIREADVILFDRLAPRELLAQAKPEARLVDVGKQAGKPSTPQSETHRLIIRHARAGRRVVRLKGGDPFVFARGGEEVEACRRAGIPCEVVPGVSSALAGPSSAGIPVTHREVSRHFVVVTAHSNGRGADLDYAALAAIDTVVVMMGRRALRDFAEKLVAAGRAGETPAAIIEKASTSKQRSVLATLASLADAADAQGIGTPAIIVVGEVAALSPQAVVRWTEQMRATA